MKREFFSIKIDCNLELIVTALKKVRYDHYFSNKRHNFNGDIRPSPGPSTDRLVFSNISNPTICPRSTIATWRLRRSMPAALLNRAFLSQIVYLGASVQSKGC